MSFDGGASSLTTRYRKSFLAASAVTLLLAVLLSVAMPEHGFTRPTWSADTSHLTAATQPRAKAPAWSAPTPSCCSSWGLPS
jgi:hypothetical protein